MDIYKKIPVFESKNYIVRGLRESDAEELLAVYSDEKAVPFFNGDNCHGDDFHYATQKRMKEAVGFWLMSYENGWFVRFTVVDKINGKAIGTIELFHRDDEKSEVYGNCGLLRLDLASDREHSADIKEILSMIKDATYDMFYCDKIVTKVKPNAAERLKAVLDLGFTRIDEPLIGNDGEEYFDYYILRK